MALGAGSRLGAYEILTPLGSGGMGEVYRAHDTRLGRDVAIKILPSAFTTDPDRLARFEREARLLAALNHPNIATIHGVEDANGMRALVLELIEGDTLADRIARGPLSLTDARTIARQLVDALDAAHEKGIIHRDLKPANVKITPDGVVKVLDFGLAKAVAGDATSPDLTQSPTVTGVGGTREGILLGTAAYMSPEQARGHAVDKRTDIWAFGCVLYEMITGRTAFPGQTISDTIAAILEREPDWLLLPASVPPSVRRLLQRCLEKDPKRRLRDIGDARIELDDARAPVQDDLTRQTPAGVTRRTAITSLASAVAGAAAAGIFAISRYRGAIPRSLTRFAIAVPEGELLATTFMNRLALSPNGRQIGFVTGGTQVTGGPAHFYLRSLSDLESTLIKDVVSVHSFFSPDGRWLGYFTPSPPSMRKIALGGGAPITIFARRAATGNSGATWADDDTIYFVSEIPGGLMSVPAAGGQPTEILKIDTAHGERTLKYPCALPRGRALLYTVVMSESESFDDAHVAVFSPHSGQKKVLVEGGTHPRYSPSGHLVYARNGNLLAVGFDPNRLEVTGQPVAVVEGVMMSRNTGVANFDVSPSGDLAYVPGSCEGGARTLFWHRGRHTACQVGGGDCVSSDAPPYCAEHPGTGRRLWDILLNGITPRRGVSPMMMPQLPGPR